MPAILRKIKSFFAIPLSSKLLFAEALFTSAFVKFTLLFLPFRRVAAWLGEHRAEPSAAPVKDASGIVNKIRAAIKLCDKYAPWPTECYTRSLTARIMLQRRGLHSTLFFGFRKDKEGKLHGHAWLKCNDLTVTGFCDFSQFEVHSMFAG